MGVYETLLEKDDKINDTSKYLDTIMLEFTNNINETMSNQCMDIIKSTIHKLFEQIEFLKEEMREKICW